MNINCKVNYCILLLINKVLDNDNKFCIELV